MNLNGLSKPLPGVLAIPAKKMSSATYRSRKYYLINQEFVKESYYAV